MVRICVVALALGSLAPGFACAEDVNKLPALATEDFEKGADHWQPFDDKQWKVKQVDGGHVYSQFEKKSSYKPPFRSPLNVALLKDVVVGDLELTAKVKSTHADYGHRDACIIFGYQSPSRFYYVHLGAKTDDHANQIFIVNDAARTKISTKTNPGTKWTDDWHHVKVVRKVAEGLIEIFYDDMETPCMTASDKTFGAGQIGVGSFDDTTDWDDVVVRGTKAEKK